MSRSNVLYSGGSYVLYSGSSYVLYSVGGYVLYSGGIMRYMIEQITKFQNKNYAKFGIIFCHFCLLNEYIVTTVNTIDYQLHLAVKLCSM